MLGLALLQKLLCQSESAAAFIKQDRPGGFGAQEILEGESSEVVRNHLVQPEWDIYRYGKDDDDEDDDEDESYRSPFLTFCLSDREYAATSMTTGDINLPRSVSRMLKWAHNRSYGTFYQTRCGSVKTLVFIGSLSSSTSSPTGKCGNMDNPIPQPTIAFCGWTTT